MAIELKRDGGRICMGQRLFVCILIFMAAFSLSALGADWDAPGIYEVTTEVVNDNPGAWTATMGEGPVNNWINAPYEPIAIQRKWSAREASSNTVVLYQGDLNGGDVTREGYLDGATVRVYRIIDGVFTKVREDTVTSGGHRQSGWRRRHSGQLVSPSSTQYQYSIASYSNLNGTYHFCVRAVNNDGVESMDSNTVAVVPGGSGGSPSNTMVSFTYPDDPTGATPSAPANLTYSVDAEGLITLSWDAVSDPDLAGYQVYISDYPPASHRGYGLDLEGSATGSLDSIQPQDLVFISHRLYTWLRLGWTANRVYSANVQPSPVPSMMPGAPDEDPGMTWELVPHPTPIPAEFVDHGQTCLKLVMTDTDEYSCKSYEYSGTGQSWYGVLQPGTTYVVEMWMRQEGLSNPVTFQLTGPHRNDVTPMDFNPTGDWQKFTGTFEVPSIYTGSQAGQMGFWVTGPGTLYIDNFRVYEQQAPFMDFPQGDYDALAESGLQFIRTHSTIKSGYGYTMNSFLDYPGVAEYRGGKLSSNHTLYSLLNIMNKAKTNPWLQMEMYMSEDEWLAFVEYLAAPYDPDTDSPAAKPWAYRRYQQGHPAPWTDDFDKIMFEISNETWNGLFWPWTFMGVEMIDSVTGESYRSGELYGLFQEHVRDILRSSPYWASQNLDAKFEFVIGGWATQRSENGYGQEAAQYSPNSKHMTVAGYNGGWDEGEPPATATDSSFFKAMAFTPQASEPRVIDQRQTLEALRDQGKADYVLGTYEAGPGYNLNGLNGVSMTPDQVEAESQVMKSLAGGVATLDAFLNRAYYGYDLQNFFTFSRNRHYWVSHAPYTAGGQAYPCWSALTLYNLHATGDHLLINRISSPTYDLPETLKRDALPNAPMTAVYGTRLNDRYGVFVLSRKMNEYPYTGDDGYSSVTLRLPFTLDTDSTITLYRMVGDPRTNNLDAENIVIEEMDIPTSAFSQEFVLDVARGAEASGVGPGSIYLYVFEGTVTDPKPANPQVTIEQAYDQQDPHNGTLRNAVKFLAAFDRPVTGFGDPGDVVFSGSAMPQNLTIEEVYGSNGMQYIVTISDMISPGNVTVSVPSNAAQAVDGDAPNDPSDSVDNEVTVEYPSGMPLLEWSFINDTVSFAQVPDSTYNHLYVKPARLSTGAGLSTGTNRYYNGDGYGVTHAHSTEFDPTDYINWFVVPEADCRISLDSIMLGAFDQVGGDEFDVALKWSTDDFATSHGVTLSPENPLVGQGLGSTAGTVVTGDLSTFSALQNTSATIEFRFYIWNVVGQYNGVGIGKLGDGDVDLLVMGTAAQAGPPQAATNPFPADGATDVPVITALQWTSGVGASSHDLYLGTNPSPAAYEFIGNQSATSYTPENGLEYGTLYYWRADARNADGLATGDVWQFRTESAPPTGTPHWELFE